MSLSGFAKTPRRLHRMTQILQVLAKHGFGHFVHRLNLQGYLPVLKRLKEVPVAPDLADEADTIPSRTRLVLQELGPTFVKLGQLLSTRPDVLPESFVSEFRKLQDHVKPFPSDQAIERVQAELGDELSARFQAFEREPRASGSIGQVHDAVLADGREAVVKIKRPGIEKVILSDLDLLGLLAERADAVPDLRVFRATMLIEEFGRAMQRELDFVSEASNTARFQQQFAGREGVRSPRVYWDCTTSSILTLERLSGEKLDDVAKLGDMGIDCREVARRLLDAFMFQYFESGLFHADPHPGNLMVTQDGGVAVIDFGMVGHLDGELRSHLGTALVGVARKDTELIVDVFGEMGVIADAGSVGLRPDILYMLDKYYGIPVRHIDAAAVFREVMEIARRHAIVLPRDFVLLGKSFVTVVSIAKSLDPTLNVRDTITPYAKALVREKLSPKRVAKLLGANAWHLTNLLQRLPREMRQLLRKALAGDLQLAFRHEGLDHFISELDRASNRLAFSVVVASLVIGSSLIVHAKVGTTILGVSALGVLGYLSALLLGVWLLIAILRSGRM